MLYPFKQSNEEGAISRDSNFGCSLMGRLICDISETRNFNRESDFAQAVRDQYFSYVAADTSPLSQTSLSKISGVAD
jgi:hypothetical protein